MFIKKPPRRKRAGRLKLDVLVFNIRLTRKISLYVIYFSYLKLKTGMIIVTQPNLFVAYLISI